MENLDVVVDYFAIQPWTQACCNFDLVAGHGGGEKKGVAGGRRDCEEAVATVTDGVVEQARSVTWSRTRP